MRLDTSWLAKIKIKFTAQDSWWCDWLELYNVRVMQSTGGWRRTLLEATSWRLDQVSFVVIGNCLPIVAISHCFLLLMTRNLQNLTWQIHFCRKDWLLEKLPEVQFCRLHLFLQNSTQIRKFHPLLDFYTGRGFTCCHHYPVKVLKV